MSGYLKFVMAERFYVDRPYVNTSQTKSRVGLAIIAVLLILIVVVIVIILLRRGSGASGTGGNGCATDVDCPSGKVCNTENGQCVQCTENGDCPLQTPFCSVTNTCVECFASSDCSGTKPICDSNTQTCVECTASSECGPFLPICREATKTCVQCITSTNCPGSAPICNENNGRCVNCLTNADCAFPATCQNGECCDSTAPSISNAVGVPETSGGLIRVVGNYTFTQPVVGATAIYTVSDSTGFQLSSEDPVPADGDMTIYHDTTPGSMIYYSGYTYQIKMRIGTTCGISSISDPVDVLMPFDTPQPPIPVIFDITATTSSIVVRLSTPNNTALGTYFGIFIISPESQPYLDPNRAFKQTTINHTASAPYLVMTGSWPFLGVQSGQKFSMRIAGSGSRILDRTSGAPVTFTVL